MTTPNLIADRECGSCNVCCVALTINDAELQKPQGIRCSHAQRDGSCAIYATRPGTCRDFYCGWRQLKWVPKTLRPDQSGVLVRLHGEVAKDGTKRLGISVTLLDKSAFKAEGLAETVAAAVAADKPVYLHVPGKPGYTSSLARINDAVAEAVAFRDKAALLAMLRSLQKQGRAGPQTRIILRPPSKAAQAVPDDQPHGT